MNINMYVYIYISNINYQTTAKLRETNALTGYHSPFSLHILPVHGSKLGQPLPRNWRDVDVLCLPVDL